MSRLLELVGAVNRFGCDAAAEFALGVFALKSANMITLLLCKTIGFRNYYRSIY